MTHLLDSSAWLAHLFGQPGVEEVSLLFDDPGIQVYISALSVPEVFARLSSMNRQSYWTRVWTNYSQLFSRVIPADEVVAHKAIELRANASQRLPTIDGLIAATALVHQSILVHRDPHMATITGSDLKSMQLPDK